MSIPFAKLLGSPELVKLLLIFVEKEQELQSLNSMIAVSVIVPGLFFDSVKTN